MIHRRCFRCCFLAIALFVISLGHPLGLDECAGLATRILDLAAAAAAMAAVCDLVEFGNLTTPGAVAIQLHDLICAADLTRGACFPDAQTHDLVVPELFPI